MLVFRHLRNKSQRSICASRKWEVQLIVFLAHVSTSLPFSISLNLIGLAWQHSHQLRPTVISILTGTSGPSISAPIRAGTSEENKAVVQGSIAYFGTYSVSEADNVIKYHIEGSTHPNWRGAEEERIFKLSGDELTLTNNTPSVGVGTAYSVWKVVK